MLNKGIIFLGTFAFNLLLINQSLAHTQFNSQSKSDYVLSDLKVLKALNLKVLDADEKLNIGLSYVSPKEQDKISKLSHTLGRCAGFEILKLDTKIKNQPKISELLKNVYKLKTNDDKFLVSRALTFQAQKNQEIENLISQASEQNLKTNIEWLSSFHDRYNRSQTPNEHVEQVITKLQQMLGFGKISYQIEKVTHDSTLQKSIRLTIPGKSRPNEIVVLGAHLDSINQRLSSEKAPGADDNASGSSNLFEALRVLIQHGPLERTLEFYWYAGEESGLLGSAEIARQYKRENKDVIAVLQLDMTLFPGEGEFVIGNVTDYTSAWLRNIFEQLNDLYIGAKLVEDECGYACSDHASWYRQGYPTLLPFEATTNTMNRNIHTTKDIITPQMSFKHSLAFTKLAIAFAIELGDSNLRQPNL